MDNKVLIAAAVILVFAGAMFGMLLSRTNAENAPTQAPSMQGMAVQAPMQSSGGDMVDHHGGGASQAASQDMSSHHTPKLSRDTAARKLDFASAVGQSAPDFTLPDNQGGSTTLSNLRGKHVVIFFNEGAMCYPSCWDQMESLISDPRFSNDHTAVLSVVVDPSYKWEQIFPAKKKLKEITMLYDTDRAVSAAYDMLWTPSSMHKGDYPGHTYLILDEEGVIRFALDDPDMGRNDEALAKALEGLGA